jgi:hypothetical protein
MFAMALVVSLLTAFHLHPHDLSLMLPAMLLIIRSPQWPRGGAWRLMLMASMGIIYIPFLYPVLAQSKRLSLLGLVLAAFLIGTNGLLNRPIFPVQGHLNEEADAMAGGG